MEDNADGDATIQTTGKDADKTTCRNADNEVSVSRSRRRICLNKDPFDVRFVFIK
jgi:hypothetical protein